MNNAGAKLEAVGGVGGKKAALPHVHAEPKDYYGGQQVWSRARTFSNVRTQLRYTDHRLVVDQLMAMLQGTGGCHTTK